MAWTLDGNTVNVYLSKREFGNQVRCEANGIDGLAVIRVTDTMAYSADKTSATLISDAVTVLTAKLPTSE